MDINLQILSAALEALLQQPPEVFWGGLFALTVIVHLYRRTRYLTAALRRERALRLKERRAHTTRLNETVKSLIELWSKAPALRLRDLADDTSSDFTLKS